MIRWEYMDLRVDFATNTWTSQEGGGSLQGAYLGPVLSRFGRDGWELLSAQTTDGTMYRVFMKRQLGDAPEEGTPEPEP